MDDKDIESSAENHRKTSRDEYMSAPNTSLDMFPHELTHEHTQSVTKRTSTGEKKPKIPRMILWIVLGVVLLGVIAGAYAYSAMRQSKTPDNTNTTQQPDTTPASTDADKLSVGFKLYVPAGGQWERPSLNISKDGESGMLTYFKNVKAGEGVTKDSYAFYVYPKKGSSYNPPADCGIPNQKPTTPPIPCTRYKGSYDVVAYIKNGQAVPSTPNPSVKSYISLFAEKEGSVIVIDSADTTAAELYALLQTMEEFSADNLPAEAITTY
jgi:hypothetical protein